MPLLEHIREDDLIFVIHCQNPKDLSQRYNFSDLNKIFQVAKKFSNFKHRSNKVSQAMFSALTDTLTYSTVLLWTIVGLMSLSMMPLAIVTGVFLLFAVTTAGFDFFSTYFKLKKADEKTDKILQFRHLQIVCYDELILRKKKINSNLNQSRSINKEDAVEKNNKNILSSLNQSMKSTLFMTTTLFGTYYAGMIAIISAFGLSTLTATLLGPIGIGAAAGIAIGVGLYFGYKYYQTKQNAKLLKAEQISVENTLETKEKEYIELNERLQKRSKQNPKCNDAEEKKCDFNRHKKDYTFTNHHPIFTRKTKLIIGHRMQWQRPRPV